MHLAQLSLPGLPKASRPVRSDHAPPCTDPCMQGRSVIAAAAEGQKKFFGGGEGGGGGAI